MEQSFLAVSDFERALLGLLSRGVAARWDLTFSRGSLRPAPDVRSPDGLLMRKGEKNKIAVFISLCHKKLRNGWRKIWWKMKRYRRFNGYISISAASTIWRHSVSINLSEMKLRCQKFLGVEVVDVKLSWRKVHRLWHVTVSGVAEKSAVGMGLRVGFLTEPYKRLSTTSKTSQNGKEENWENFLPTLSRIEIHHTFEAYAKNGFSVG